MRKLVKYLKPFIGFIVLTVVLTFVEAMCELKLPNYMSGIVNIGIMQNGIEDAVPQTVTSTRLEELCLFLSDEDAALLKGQYTADGEYLTLGDLDDETRAALVPSVSRAYATISLIEASGGSINSYDELPVADRLSLSEELTYELSIMGESTLYQSAIRALIADYQAIGVDLNAIQMKYILRQGVFMLLISLVTVAVTVSTCFTSSRVGTGVSRAIRRDVFRKVESFSQAEFDKFSTASLITRSTNDVMQVQMVVVMMLRMMMMAPMMGIGGLIYAIKTNVSLVWILALAVAMLVGMIATLFSIATPRFKRMQKLMDKLNLVSRENLSGMMVIRAYNTQKFEEERFAEANGALTGNRLFVDRWMNIMHPMMSLIMNGVSLLIIWVGANQIAQANMQVGDMMAYMQYSMHVVMSFMMISMMFVTVPRASVSAGRVAEVLETEVSIKDPELPANVHAYPERRGEIVFDHVCFRFPGAEKDTLHDISFVARPGETTAFIGSTGSGKSTLINLIPRFYDVTEGSVTVNGIDVRDLTQHDLRSEIGYVPQKGILFTGTIDSNLRYGAPDADEETIRKAAEIAQATEFINAREYGYNTPVAQMGINVSGGQKQRLSIARALVKQAPIYIFDDSFSALDFKTDAKLRKALSEETGDSTLLIVAQRVGTIKNAEQIIVLDEGRIVGKGTHEELMQSCDIYQQIAYSQLSAEELM